MHSEKQVYAPTFGKQNLRSAVKYIFTLLQIVSFGKILFKIFGMVFYVSTVYLVLMPIHLLLECIQHIISKK